MRRRAVPAALLLALTLGVGAAHAEPAADELELRHPPSSSRWKIIVAGVATTLVAYGGAAAMGGAFSDVPGRDMLFIPVAGPWIALGEGGCAPDEETTKGQGDCEGWLAVRGILYVIDGLVQLGGLGITAEGIFMTTEADGPAEPKKALVMPAPIVSERSIGFGLVGAF